MPSVTLLALSLILAGPSCIASALESPSRNAGNVSLDKGLRDASDDATSDGWIDDARLLQSTYVDPSWWQQYKGANGKHFKRCKFQENVAPASGTACRRMKVGDYTCMFGDQTCPDGSTHPAITCDCFGVAGGIWDCEEFNVCEPATAEPVTTCPSEHPITFNPPLACSGDLTCAIGQQSCCGDTFPRYECTCKNGVFDCEDDRSCDKRVCPPAGVCPVDPSDQLNPPEEGSFCALQPEETCVYDETCCRETCAPLFHCTCENNQWNCNELRIACPEPVTDFPSFAPSEAAVPAEDTTCPVIPGEGRPPPQQGSTCSLPTDMTCHYNEVCCPDSSTPFCSTLTSCACDNGAWKCDTIFLVNPCQEPATEFPSAAPIGI